MDEEKREKGCVDKEKCSTQFLRNLLFVDGCIELVCFPKYFLLSSLLKDELGPILLMLPWGFWLLLGSTVEGLLFSYRTSEKEPLLFSSLTSYVRNR